METGKKNDKGKLMWSLIPTGPMREIVKVFMYGMDLYGYENWKHLEPRRVYDAIHRHITAWWDGERVDPETGLHHMAHAATNCIFLIWLCKNRKGV